VRGKATPQSIGSIAYEPIDRPGWRNSSLGRGRWCPVADPSVASGAAGRPVLSGRPPSGCRAAPAAYSCHRIGPRSPGSDGPRRPAAKLSPGDGSTPAETVARVIQREARRRPEWAAHGHERTSRSVQVSSGQARPTLSKNTSRCSAGQRAPVGSTSHEAPAPTTRRSARRSAEKELAVLQLTGVTFLAAKRHQRPSTAPAKPRS
jgi:hypothetical protein